MDYKDPMLANFIELLAEILVESLDHAEDSQDIVSGAASACAATTGENDEAGMRGTPQPVVPETTV